MTRWLLALLLLAAPAAAQQRACVNHQDIVIAPGAILASPAGLTLRERWLTLPGRLWDRTWGPARRLRQRHHAGLSGRHSGLWRNRRLLPGARGQRGFSACPRRAQLSRALPAHGL